MESKADYRNENYSRLKDFLDWTLPSGLQRGRRILHAAKRRYHDVKPRLRNIEV